MTLSLIGSTQRKGASAIKMAIDNGTFVGAFLQMASLCDRQMGGTSGAILSLLFTSLSAALRETSTDDQSKSVAIWSSALRTAIETISKYSLAQPGDRTMLDTLDAVQRCLEQNIGSTDLSTLATRVANAADDAAEKTARMQALAGRASYVNQDRISRPDPGAVAVAIWVKAVAAQLTA